LNLFRARKNSPFLIVFGIHRSTVQLVVVEHGKSQEPSLVVSDQEQVNSDDHAAIMQGLYQKYSRYFRHHPELALVMGTGLYQSVTLDKPPLNDEELAASLRYQLSDLVSYEAEDCIADYYELPVQVQGQNKIHAVACSRSFLEPMLEVIHKTTERVVGIYAEEQALGAMLRHHSEACAVVYQQVQQPALVQVYNNGTLQVTRAVRALEKLSELSAEEIRMGGLEPLSVEVQRSADYFERQLRQRPLVRVLLALPFAKSTDVIDRLHGDLGLDVQWAPYPAWTQELAVGDYSDFPALGGALMILERDNEEAAE
jgi:MSHA biogenesis protein MshI